MKRSRSRTTKKVDPDFVAYSEEEDDEELDEAFDDEIDQEEDEDFEEEEEKPKPRARSKKPVPKKASKGAAKPQKKKGEILRSKSVLSSSGSVVEGNRLRDLSDVQKRKEMEKAQEEEKEDDDEEVEVEALLGSISVDCVGIRFYDGVVENREMAIIRREPQNQYDRNAIQVLNLRNRQVGHVKKVKSAVSSCSAIMSQLTKSMIGMLGKTCSVDG
jgi:hypothetical protein